MSRQMHLDDWTPDVTLEPFEIERLLAEAVQELRRGIGELSEASRNAAHAEADYKQQYHIALVTAVGSDDLPPLPGEEGKAAKKRAHPEWYAKEIASRNDRVEKLFRQWRIADEVRSAIADAQRTRREIVGALRTMAANARGHE